jgi:hypothetical protein
MSLTKATYSMITGAPNNVLDFGADPTGVADSTSAIQAFIDAGGGYVPPGTYNVSSTLVVKNRITIEGPKDSWSPLPTRNAVFKWTGAAGGNIFQASTTAIGTPATNALTSVRLQNFTIDGDDVAGVGLFINYASNESVFDGITVIKCAFGIVAAKLWYCRLTNLTARNCSVIGISIGMQYESSYDITVINGVRMDNLRAAQCGSRYNASTNPYGFGASNIEGGAGIVLRPSAGCFISQIVSETNYGPGLSIKSLSRNEISGIYLEDNCGDAVTDGEVSYPYGLVLCAVSEAGFKSINALYMHTGNRNIYLSNVINTAGVYVLDSANLIERIDSASGTNSILQISNVSNSNVSYPLQNADYFGTAFDATYEGTRNTGTTGTPIRNSRARITAFAKQTNWASGATLTVCTINVNTGTTNNGTAGSVLLNLNIGTGVSGGDYDSHSFTYVVSFSAWQKESTLGSSRVNAAVTQLGTVQEKNAADLLGSLTLSAVVSVPSPADTTATIELQISPTSTGTQSLNSISASAVFLSGAFGSLGRVSTIS